MQSASHSESSVDASLIVIAQIFIYRFSKVGLAITVENCV